MEFTDVTVATTRRTLEDGTTQWEDPRTGVLHRPNGPAIEYPTGRHEWWVEGIRHRVDGPAVVEGDASWWYRNGRLHRKDGPAVDTATRQEWWVEGHRHRAEGPAVEQTSGRPEWWFGGRKMSKAEHARAVKALAAWL